MSQRAEINLLRAGEFFMYCLWLQSQMTDLLILQKDPDLRQPFVANPAQVPTDFALKRVEYWQKDLGEVKRAFEERFRDHIHEQHQEDLHAIYYLRNAIAHSHVSIARDYLLYRPGRGEKHEAAMRRALKLQPVENQAHPTMMPTFRSPSRRFAYFR